MVIKEGINKFKIIEGRDHYTGNTIYRLVGINNDFLGEWQDARKEAENEVNKL
jgi:hypothetical protein